MKKWSFVFGLSLVLALSFLGGSVKAASCPLATDAMYKSPGSKAVYYITTDCKKQFVKSPDVFFSYVDSWSEVKGTNYATLMSVPDHSLRILPWGPRRTFLGGSLVKSPTDPRVFLVTKYSPNGQLGPTTLVPFDSEQAFKSNGYQWSWVEDVAQSVITNTPISAFSITADWRYYPAGVLFKLANSSALYLTRSESGKTPYNEYVGSLDELKNRRYRFDRVPNFPDTFFSVDTFGLVPIGSQTPATSGPEDGAVCNDSDTVTSGSVMLCQGTTVRVTSFMKAKVAAVTPTEVVVTLTKNGGSSQTWTIPVGQTKSSVFFEDPNNTFGITFEKQAVSSRYNKSVAFLKLVTTAAVTSKPAQTPVSDKCQNRTGEDGSYDVCVDNTIYQTNNLATFKIISYTSESVTLSYSVRRSDGVNDPVGTVTVRLFQSELIPVPILMRSLQVSYLGKANGGWATVSIATKYDHYADTVCGPTEGGDGEFTLCMGQQYYHSGTGIGITLKSVYMYTAKLRLDSTKELSTLADNRVWDLDIGGKDAAVTSNNDWASGKRIRVTVTSVGSDNVTVKITTL